MMKLRFWGTRGSVPVPGRETIVYGGNTSCTEVVLDSGKKVILDSGTGIRSLGDFLTSRGETVDLHLLITHIHWDHVLGFPFFSPIHDPTAKITVDGCSASIKGLKLPFDAAMGFFPVGFDELKADIKFLDSMKSGKREIDGVVIDSIALHHPQGGLGFRFDDGKRILIFLTDNELTQEALSGKHGEEDYIKFCENADILIHDAQYMPEEIASRRGWGHSDYASALQLATRANVKHLILYHHDPSRKDPQLTAIVEGCRELAKKNNLNIIIDAAKEGGELSF